MRLEKVRAFVAVPGASLCSPKGFPSCVYGIQTGVGFTLFWLTLESAIVADGWDMIDADWIR